MIRRRDDTEDIVLRIRDQLLWRYGKDGVAPDLWARSFKAYAALVQQQMARCDVVLVLPGPRWRMPLMPRAGAAPVHATGVFLAASVHCPAVSFLLVGAPQRGGLSAALLALGIRRAI